MRNMDFTYEIWAFRDGYSGNTVSKKEFKKAMDALQEECTKICKRIIEKYDIRLVRIENWRE